MEGPYWPTARGVNRVEGEGTRLFFDRQSVGFIALLFLQSFSHVVSISYRSGLVA